MVLRPLPNQLVIVETAHLPWDDDFDFDQRDEVQAEDLSALDLLFDDAVDSRHRNLFARQRALRSPVRTKETNCFFVLVCLKKFVALVKEAHSRRLVSQELLEQQLEVKTLEEAELSGAGNCFSTCCAKCSARAIWCNPLFLVARSVRRQEKKKRRKREKQNNTIKKEKEKICFFFFFMLMKRAGLRDWRRS